MLDEPLVPGICEYWVVALLTTHVSNSAWLWHKNYGHLYFNAWATPCRACPSALH
jgi:hypothetical protein